MLECIQTPIFVTFPRFLLLRQRPFGLFPYGLCFFFCDPHHTSCCTFELPGFDLKKVGCSTRPIPLVRLFGPHFSPPPPEGPPKVENEHPFLSPGFFWADANFLPLFQLFLFTQSFFYYSTHIQFPHCPLRQGSAGRFVSPFGFGFDNCSSSSGVNTVFFCFESSLIECIPSFTAVFLPLVTPFFLSGSFWITTLRGLCSRGIVTNPRCNYQIDPLPDAPPVHLNSPWWGTDVFFRPSLILMRSFVPRSWSAGG